MQFTVQAFYVRVWHVWLFLPASCIARLVVELESERSNWDTAACLVCVGVIRIGVCCCVWWLHVGSLLCSVTVVWCVVCYSAGTPPAGASACQHFCRVQRNTYIPVTCDGNTRMPYRIVVDVGWRLWLEFQRGGASIQPSCLVQVACCAFVVTLLFVCGRRMLQEACTVRFSSCKASYHVAVRCTTSWRRRTKACEISLGVKVNSTVFALHGVASTHPWCFGLFVFCGLVRTVDVAVHGCTTDHAMQCATCCGITYVTAADNTYDAAAG
jgi:hypothetical protein